MTLIKSVAVPARVARTLALAAAVIASLAFAYSLWAIAGAGADVVYWGFLLLFGGLPVYVWIVQSRDSFTARSQ